MSKILLIGEPMALLTADRVGSLEAIEHFTRTMAGAEVNVCIGLTRLGHQVIYVTKLGDDPFGHYIKKSLERENITTDFINFDSIYKTGIQLKSKVLKGDPVAPYYRKGSAASRLCATDIDEINFSDITYVHITGISPALSGSCRKATYRLIERAREHGVFVSFDPNLRPALWANEGEMIEVINDLASMADIVLPGVEEGMILMGSDDPEKIADFYQNLNINQVVVKVGPEGAYVRDGDKSEMITGFKVDEVVDTVGAGDGFAVGVISGLVEGLTLKAAVLRGNAIGAIQVTHSSDNEGLPDKEKLRAFMSSK